MSTKKDKRVDIDECLQKLTKKISSLYIYIYFIYNIYCLEFDGGFMNKLLRRQRFFISFTLFIKTIFIVSLVLIYVLFPEYQYYLYVAILFLAVFSIFDSISAIAFNLYFQKKKGKTETTSAEILGNELNEAYNFGEIGLAVTNKDNEILWVNDFFSKRIPNIVDEKIDFIFPELSSIIQENATAGEAKITCENHTYHVEYLRDVRLFVFKDTTELDNVTLLNQRQAPVVGYISIDNYTDIQMFVSDEIRFADMAAKTRNMIQEFSLHYNAMLRRLKEDRYFFVTTKENFDKLYDDKFPIIDDVRKAFENGFTLSIGVSYGFDDYSKLSELASSAIDVALSRGGDQAVISPFGQSLMYFGGKTELKPNRNRVQVRELSRSFLAIIKSYPKVLIMGHDTADFDAVGSALGAYNLCLHAGVNARICWEDQHVEDNARIAVRSNFSNEDMEKIFINFKDCNEWIDKNTLLLAVDHNNPLIAMFGEIVKKMTNIAVIDHHRPGPSTYTGYVFNGIDTSASSASEIVMAYMSYNSDDIEVDERTATFLLSGIALDTHFFKEKATEATFEIAAQLKKHNADSSKVEDFLRENLEEYKQKISILNSNKMYQSDIMICWSPDSDNVNSVMLSKVATEAINIRGIVCSFCVGRLSSNEIKISARSDGSVNCQILMQKLGGGGHFAMSATTISGIDVDTAIKRLETVLNDYLEDARIKS